MIPSIIGLLLFVIPLPWGGGSLTIGVGYFAAQFQASYGEILPAFMVYIVIISAVITLFSTIIKPNFVSSNKFLKDLFIVKPLTHAIRIGAAVLAYAVLYSVTTLGFDKISNPNTGGVVITDKQYKEGYYTVKEASIISVCFSLVSLPFAVFIASFLKLSVSFIAFYGTISIASLVVALVLPRIYPLNKKKDEYIEGIDVKINEEVPAGRGIHEWAVERGIIRATQAPTFIGLITSGLKTVADVYFSLMPIVMLLGTVSLVVAEYTPIFSLISKPLIPLFNLMRVPDSSLAASATLVGFADMFLPAIFVKGSEFEITRFIIGALSFTQLIYLTETGAIILRSKIPVNFKDLFIIFIERTLITLPIIVMIAHLIY